MVPKGDWRRFGQEECLTGVPLKFVARFTPPKPTWDHEHCEFCWAKISPYEGDLPGGYCTLDEYHWICPECYEDFKEEFGWTLEHSEEYCDG